MESSEAVMKGVKAVVAVIFLAIALAVFPHFGPLERHPADYFPNGFNTRLHDSSKRLKWAHPNWSYNLIDFRVS